jgi:hypothetical protein
MCPTFRDADAGLMSFTAHPAFSLVILNGYERHGSLENGDNNIGYTLLFTL